MFSDINGFDCPGIGEKKVPLVRESDFCKDSRGYDGRARLEFFRFYFIE